MIGFIITILITLGAVLLVYVYLRYDLENLESDLKVLKQDINYKLALPQIAELANLRGFDGYFQIANGDVRFYGAEEVYVVAVYKVETELADLKKAIEISCQKKCAKKK